MEVRGEPTCWESRWTQRSDVQRSAGHGEEEERGGMHSPGDAKPAQRRRRNPQGTHSIRRCSKGTSVARVSDAGARRRSSSGAGGGTVA